MQIELAKSRPVLDETGEAPKGSKPGKDDETQPRPSRLIVIFDGSLLTLRVILTFREEKISTFYFPSFLQLYTKKSPGCNVSKTPFFLSLFFTFDSETFLYFAVFGGKKKGRRKMLLSNGKRGWNLGADEEELRVARPRLVYRVGEEAERRDGTSLPVLRLGNVSRRN